MRISIITAVRNRVGLVGQAIASVQAQRWPEREHVVVDGASSDGTLELVREACDGRTVLISEPDAGLYHALNKGIARASGEVIGLMHSDDFFADGEVLAAVGTAFAAGGIDAVYGDLQYVDRRDPTRVVRHWRAGEFYRRNLAWGWMPPHPTLFLHRRVLDRFGLFDTRFRISADYEAILRYFSGGIRAVYLPRVLVKMRLGGESNGSLGGILRKSWEDYHALRYHRLGGLGALAWKNLSKVGQFL